MATSGDTTYNQTRDQVVLDAFQVLGVYGIGRTVSSEDMTFATSTLNKMIKSWSARGLHLWAKDEATLFLTPYQASYTISGATGSDHASIASDVVTTRLSVALATSATAVTVTSTVGMTIGDHIGVVLNDKTTHWTTIATIPTSTTLTLTVGVVSAASNLNLVYTYTNKLPKPLRILDARIVQGIDLGSAGSTLFENPMTALSYEEYMEIPIKTSSGLPLNYSFKPKDTNSTMYLWLRPNDSNFRINFTYERIIEDLDNITDNFDFPSEWLEPLTWQLALRLALPFGKMNKLAALQPMAAVMLDNLLSYDSEITSVNITPDMG